MGEFFFGQAVEVGDDGVKLGAEFGTYGGIGGAILVAFQASGFGQGVEFGGGANQPGGEFYAGGGLRVFLRQARDGEMPHLEDIRSRNWEGLIFGRFNIGLNIRHKNSLAVGDLVGAHQYSMIQHWSNHVVDFLLPGV